MKTRILKLKRPTEIKLIGVCLVAALLVGCATAHRLSSSAGRPALLRSSLPSERDVPLLAALGTAYDLLPHQTSLVPTERSNHVVRVAVHEFGPGTRDSLVILLHGVLACHRTWRYVTAELAGGHDVWLVDLPGCGESERPDPTSLEADGYSPAALADRVLQAIAARLNARRFNSPLRRVVLASHSLGGMIALRAYGDPILHARHSATLEQIDGMVLFAPSDAAIHSEIPAFRNCVDLKGWKVAIGQPLGLVRHGAEKTIHDGYHTPEHAIQEWADELEHLLSGGGTRRAAQAMLTQAVPWHVKERRPDWPAIQHLASFYANIDVPRLIVWGEWDETLPASMGHKLKDEISHARLTRIERCGHALPTEKPVECAEIISEFVKVMDNASFDSLPLFTRYGEKSPFRKPSNLLASPSRMQSPGPVSYDVPSR